MKGNQVPYMQSPSTFLNKKIEEGYTVDFKAENGKLKSLETEKMYGPTEINIVDFHRFEGNSNPDDNSIVYVIETSDGTKGTIMDAYGAYADAAVAKLIVQIEEIQKENATKK